MNRLCFFSSSRLVCALRVGLMAFVLCTLFFPHTAQAYKRSTSSKGTELIWITFPIPYHINRDATANADKDATYTAIQTSFDTWQSQSCTCLTFSYKGLRAESDIGYDQSKPEENLNLVVFQTSSWSHDRRAVAVTSTVFRTDNGVIVAFDMELNNLNYRFSLNGQSRTMDIQNTVTHEVGHVIGLDHSTNNAATMFAAGQPGETSKRNLAQDDINGLCTIYPTTGCKNEAPPSVDGCGCQSQSPGSLGPFLSLLLFLLAFRLRRFLRPKGAA